MTVRLTGLTMYIHQITVLAVLAAITIIEGLLLLMLWRKREISAGPFVSAIGFIVYGGGWALFTLRELTPLTISSALAHAFVILGLGLIRDGMRRFAGLQPRTTTAVFGALIWLACYVVLDLGTQPQWRVSIASGIEAIYPALAVRDLWRIRRERLPSLGLALFFFTALAVIFVVRAQFSALTGYGATGSHATTWFAVFVFANILIMTALMQVIGDIDRERSNTLRATVGKSGSDGVRDRNAFVLDARNAIRTAWQEARPVTLILFSLRVTKPEQRELGGYLAVVHDFLRPNDVLGRMQREVFGCLLSDVGSNDAAGFLRHLVRSALPQVKLIGIGIASSEQVGHDLKALMSSAELALHGAVAAGHGEAIAFTSIPNDAIASGSIHAPPRDAPGLTLYRRIAAYRPARPSNAPSPSEAEQQPPVDG